MKNEIELKKVQVFEAMSEETRCFVADVYWRGQKVGGAKNDGQGGATLLHVPHAIIREMAPSARAQLSDDWRKFLPEGGGEAFTVVEMVVDQLVEEWEQAKEERRYAKIDQREAAKNLARGYPITVRIYYQAAVTWLAVAEKNKALVDLLADHVDPKHGKVLCFRVVSS